MTVQHVRSHRPIYDYVDRETPRGLGERTPGATATSYTGVDEFGEPSAIRPDWHADALCRGALVDGRCDWFPEQGDSEAAARAKQVCRRCPARIPCAAAGLHEQGIWGGR